MGNPTITRFPNGVTNTAENSGLGDLPFMNPTKYITFFNDFFTYAAGDWTVTETDAAATEALAAGNGGWLLITNTAADNDLVSMQGTVAEFTPTAAKNFFFSTRFKVSDATQTDVLMGIATVDTSPIASLPTAGFFFLKPDDAATVDFHIRAAGTSTTLSAVATLADDTFIELSMSYQPALGVVQVFVNGVMAAQTTVLTNVPLTACTRTMALQAGEAVAKTMTVDWFFAALQR